MYMNRTILNILGITFIFALAAIFISAFLLVGIENKKADEQARHNCALISKYEVDDGDATVSYPVKDVYQDCLVEKGLK